MAKFQSRNTPTARFCSTRGGKQKRAILAEFWTKAALAHQKRRKSIFICVLDGK
jgi:hypothetical protein